MPRGYRYVILAAFGWLILANSQPEKRTTEQQKPTGNQIAKPAPAPTSRKAFGSVDPAKYKPPCQEPKDHDRCDLEAQWKAADAADRSAWWAVVQAWLSLAGVAGLIYSLILTRRAVKAAAEAGEDADRALAIAERNAAGAMRAAVAAGEGNTIARESMQRQLRPYVYLFDVSIDIKHMLTVDYIADTADATVVIRNYGQSPAKSVRLFAKASIGNYWSDRPSPDLAGAMGLEFGDIPTNEERQQSGFYVHGISAAHREIVEGTKTVFVEGQVQYQDLFGNEYVSYFQRAFSGNGYWSNKAIITPHWNSAT